MVSYEGEKMSKSLGNLVFVSDLLKIADPRAIRLALMRHHYRAGFEWHDTDLDEGNALLHRLLAAADRHDGADPRPYAEQVRHALDADLDAPKALEALDDLASAILSGGSDPTAPAVLHELGDLIGVDFRQPVEHRSRALRPFAGSHRREQQLEQDIHHLLAVGEGIVLGPEHVDHVVVETGFALCEVGEVAIFEVHTVRIVVTEPLFGDRGAGVVAMADTGRNSALDATKKWIQVIREVVNA